MLVDTSFLIDILRGHEPALKELARLEQRPEALHIPTVTLFELYRGLARSSDSIGEEERIEEVLGSRPTLPLSPEAARKGGREDGDLAKEGSPIDPEDAMIAGIALAHGMPVVTANADHFERVEGLNVLRYR